MSSNAGQDGPPGVAPISITHDMASAHKIVARIGMIFDDKIIWSSLVGQTAISSDTPVGQFIASRTEAPRPVPYTHLTLPTNA